MSALTTREQRTAAAVAELLCTQYERDNMLGMVGRIHRLLDGVGIPEMDIESRVAYLIGSYKALEEIENENNND
jgi:hypothetical protein